MKPRTRHQVVLAKIQEQLPELTNQQEAYAHKHCLSHKAVRLKSGSTTCLDCGHNWIEEMALVSIIAVECPGCGTKLKVENTRKKNFHEWSYFEVIQTFKGYQVIRLFKVNGNYKAGKPANISIWRCSEIWIDEKGHHECYGYIHSVGYGYVSHSWTASFELRGRNTVGNYNIRAYKTYPEVTVLPVLKRNGFNKKALSKVSTWSLFRALLTDSASETLIKAKQYSLFASRVNQETKAYQYWDSIKICMRNNYIVNDAASWYDYLDLLVRYGKDIRNAKFVCPADFKGEHDRYVAKRREEMRRAEEERNRLNLEKQKQRAAKAAAHYAEMRAAFFGLCFEDDDLRITVLQSVEEFKAEGDAHKHCVYTNAYYEKKDSLIMSAQLNGIRIETIELQLSTLRIVQSRGLRNEATPHNSRIIDLVNRNLDKVKKAIAQSKRKKKAPQPAEVVTNAA